MMTYEAAVLSAVPAPQKTQFNMYLLPTGVPMLDSSGARHSPMYVMVAPPGA